MANKTGPQIAVASKVGSTALIQRLNGLGKLAAYVGVPAAGRNARAQQLLAMSGKTNNKKQKTKLAKSALGDINNAELLFIHEHGSPIKHIPARPVLLPAVSADGNRQAIAHELAGSVQASLVGDKEGAKKGMLRTALAGQNAVRKWFTDPRNAWAPNAPSTIRRKKSDRPLIDTGALRAAIVGVVREE